MRLSEENKSKLKTISKLKAEIDELKVYGNGYDKGIKEVKKELLVLRFVNNTKTSLLRKYAEKLESSHKYIDAADLRPQLQFYLQKEFQKSAHYLTENIYLRNQLKFLADQSGILNTAHLCDFFIQKLEIADREKQSQASKQASEMKRTRQKIDSLSTTMQLHRTNHSHIPGVIHALFEEHFSNNEGDKTIEIDLNNHQNSRPTSTNKEIFLTSNKMNDLEIQNFFIKDFSVEFYAGLDDVQRKELLQKLFANKKLLFGYREYLLRKFNPLGDTSRGLLGRGNARTQSFFDVSRRNTRVTGQQFEQTSSSVSRHKSEKATDSERSYSVDAKNRSKTMYRGLDKLHQAELDHSGEAYHPKLSITDITFEANKTKGNHITNEKIYPPLHVDVLKKRKLLRYIVKHTGASLSNQG